tara:strand:- start:3347 stop:3820 length:474 start_codon:yes stop_codon:yes gene_type:complete
MAGYNFYAGMSNNALNAYEDGKKPLSRITALDLKLAGWRGTKAEALRLAKSEFWKPCEWHHSGGTWFNRVDFYDPADLVECWNDATDAERLNALKKEEPKPEEKRVRGEFTIWGGTRRRPRKVGTKPFIGTLKNNWIFLDSGGKKKANGNHIKWEVV